MSKINRIRIVNLNYNRNTIRIDDETLELNGESTLLSLRNGGGKTVLVQIIIALFVNSSYRNMNEREFKSYFTTNQPTFIMVEWCLDRGQGYFLTGMMVRKSQNMEEDNKEDLDLCNFTGFYCASCEYDLEHLPIVEDIKGKRILKSFGACRKELEELKKRNREFSYYDMTQPYQRKMYFSKLKEYQINHKEWETIIKKVNGKESGLSELFANAKDEKGLIEKWILTAIEGKLNQENDRVQEFRTLAYKLIQSYRENETKLHRKEVMEVYFQDAEIIKKQITVYEEAEQALIEQKNQIAVFIFTIDTIFEDLEQKLFLRRKEEEELLYQLRKLEQEEFSYQIYQYEDEKKELLHDRLDLEERIQRSVYIRQEAEKELCLFQCSRLYKEATDFEREVKKLQEQINILVSEQKDSKQEQKKLGGILYWFYENQIATSKQVLEEKKKQMLEQEEKQKETIEKIQKEIEKEKEISEKIGSLSSALKVFDKIEQRFHQKFSIKFLRNIIGEYEDGILILYEKEFEDELIEVNTGVTKLTEQAALLKKEEIKVKEEKENFKIDKIRNRSEHKLLEEKIETLEKEKSRRSIIMQYLQVSEQELNQKTFLLQQLEQKIAEMESMRDEYKRKMEEVKKEYKNLKQGIIMELPEKMQAFFEEQNIEIISGISWLKKNGRTVKENQKLVKNNPFLPYCFIVNKIDLEKFQNAKDIYTNIPIPMILRENLEESVEREEHGLISFGKINFFLLFNHHLLSKKELEQLLEEKNKEINVWLERIERKAEEIKQYRSYYVEIEQQEFTVELMEHNREQKKKTEEEYQKLIEDEEVCKEKLKELIKKQENIIEQIELARDKKRKTEQKREEFAEFKLAYEQYLEDKRNLDRYQRRRKETEYNEKLLREKQIMVEEHIVSFRNEVYAIQKELETYQEKITLFLSYQNEEKQELPLDFDISEISVRYQAMTEGISSSLKELNENLRKEKARYDKKKMELDRKNKYAFSEEQYRDVTYSEEQELHLEGNIEKAAKEENAAKEAQVQLEKDMTRVETKLEDIKRRLQEKTGSEILIERKKIVDSDFAARRKLNNYDKEKKEQEIKRVLEHCNCIQNVQAAMAEYSDFKVIQEDETEKDLIESLSKTELIAYSGNLRRQLNQKNKNWEQEQYLTEKLILNLSKKECYQEDFFKKGFENLLSLVGKVADLNLQLTTLLASYESSLKKLQVDLLSIDRERDNLEELFLEYLHDIDEHMHQIDKNSTIPVRGKGLKMLRLQVPDWESHKELYQKKLKDFMETLIKRGLEAVENDENIQELLGKLITTKKLYDDMIGIGTINIHLYKIEAEREVLISWKEVSSNSGGEGFLSAFVILACLLSYMRRDENDLFAGNGEGKVLIMDNPFAQTNAVHLLKPMMDMAKRTNTQLICLSGLGGDSIYNRFDNIYVLNLVNSSLRHMQYLKGEHIKGEEISTMVLSQFQMEQMELF